MDRPTDAHAPTWPARALIGLPAYPIGLGGAGLSFNASVDERRAIETVHAAIDAGVTVIDTARAYTRPLEAEHNERLIALALREYGARPNGLTVVTKGGEYWIDPEHWALDGSPGALRRDCEASLAALAVTTIDLYLLHWPDPAVPIEASVEALAALVEDGLVAHVGLSNVTAEQLERARGIALISAVENHFSPFDPGDRAMVDTCASLGIAYLAYSPFGGPKRPKDIQGRFPVSTRVAAELGASVHQVWLAWILHTSPAVIPLVGATRATTIREAVGAVALDTSRVDWQQIEAELRSGAVPGG